MYPPHVSRVLARSCRCLMCCVRRAMQLRAAILLTRVMYEGRIAIGKKILVQVMRKQRGEYERTNVAESARRARSTGYYTHDLGRERKRSRGGLMISDAAWGGMRRTTSRDIDHEVQLQRPPPASTATTATHPTTRTSGPSAPRTPSTTLSGCAACRLPWSARARARAGKE